MNESGNVLGSYLHGLFDDGQLFASIVRAGVNMDAIYRILRGEV